jgi:hypothetical protein
MVGAIAGAAIDLATPLQRSVQAADHERSIRDSTHLTQEITAPSEENWEGYEFGL